MTMMSSEHRSQGVAERVFELVVYAPVGAIDMLRTDAPRLIAGGRQRFEQQVRTARWIGEMAVTVGRQKAEQRWSAFVARDSGAGETSSGAASASSVARPTGDREPERTAEVLAEPFHGYDALPASDLVQLLFRLTHSELELVQQYESATRARRTVLAKIDQLLGAT